jgi:hypothetical protein
MEMFLMISQCVLVLMLSLMSPWPQSSQDAPAKGDNKDVCSRIAGVWRGHSECAVKNSPCHDEVNVYRFSKVASDTNRFSVTASKVVGGKEIVMGSSEWKYDEKKQVVECEKPSIQLTIAGDTMEGALRLEDGTVYRRIYLKKEN